MTVPKSYEALAVDLASEKILSKTLIGQKEAYMMLADQLKLDLATWKQKAFEAAEREAPLREELEALRESYEAMRDRKNSIVDLQQRLTFAEKRADLLEGLLKSGSSPTYAHCSAVMEALKPAAEGEGTKPQEAYEVFPDSPGGYYNGCPPSALADPMQCWRDGYEIAKKRAITAGLKVKP